VHHAGAWTFQVTGDRSPCKPRAEILLAEYGAVAALDGIGLTVGYLKATAGNLAAECLRAAGIEPELVGIPPASWAPRAACAGTSPAIARRSCTSTSAVPTCSARPPRARCATIHSHAWHSGGARA
jgi:hypothetical protein